MHYRFIDSLPSSASEIDSLLLSLGFRREEENTTDCVREVDYIKTFANDSSNAKFRFVLRFELYLSDCPTASYDENCEMTYDSAFLEVYDRRMERDRFACRAKDYDPDTENPQFIDTYPLSFSDWQEIEPFFAVLKA